MRIFRLTLLLLAFNSVNSQTPPFHVYNTSNGLPSTTVYDIIQDKNGYIWIATNNGLSQFNGTRFKNYDVKDGLNSNNIVSLAEGNNNEIYICTHFDGINFFKDGKIFPYTEHKNNSKFIKIIFYRERLFGYGNYGDAREFKKDENVFRGLVNYKNKFEKWNTANNEIFSFEKDKFYLLTSKGIFENQDKEFVRSKIEGLNDEEINCITKDKDNNFYAGSLGKIFIIKDQKVINTIYMDSPFDKVYKILYDRNGNLWYSIMNEGFRVLKRGAKESLDLSKKFRIPKAVVNKIFEDNEGNIWLSTFGKGIFCVYNRYIENYNEDDGLINNSVNAIELGDSGNLILGTFNGISIMHGNKIDAIKLKENNLNDYIYELNKENNDLYINISMNNKNFISMKSHGMNFYYLFGPSLEITKDRSFILGLFGNNFTSSKRIEKLHQNRIILSERASENRVNVIHEDPDQNLFIGTQNGLYKYVTKDSSKSEKIGKYNSEIHSIVQEGNEFVWIAGDGGVSKINMRSLEISELTGTDLSYSTSIAFDNKKRMWIGGIKGLTLYDNGNIKQFNVQTGLPSNEILTLKYDSLKNILWIGSRNGFTSFNINLYDQTKPPVITCEIDLIKSGDSVYYASDNKKIELDNNNVHIGFFALNYSIPATLSYQYKINDDWIDSKSDFIDFNELKGRDYNIFIRAKVQNSEWSEPALVSFSIKPALTETIYFQVLILLAFGLLIFLGAKYRININKKKNAAKIEIAKKMDELKYQALSSMMNPHFIFNSLNSVQYLVNNDQKEEANNYIAMMAKLIRYNLDIAGKSFIKISDELHRLKLYLEIEKLRFNEKFDYEISVSDNLDQEKVMIPNMIIQPFVENSIWHGIMKSKVKGKIKVSFMFNDIQITNKIVKALVIKISDNGIGYLDSKKYKDGIHISKGISIIEERLKLLSQMIEISKPIIIDDLKEQDPGMSGTEVIISLPPTLYKVNVS